MIQYHPAEAENNKQESSDMSEMTSVKKSIICAVCIALCYILPLFFHGIQNAGSIFSPMHIPVFICGLICGWQYGLFCGIAGPAISSALTGMPPIAMLPSMMVELALYGLIAGLMMKIVRTGSTLADLYISLTVAIVIGRIAAGATRAFIFAKGTYSLAMWISAYVITSWPGTLIQFIFIPMIIMALMKSHIIEERYPAELPA
jgi:hypothetical protein